MFIRIETEITSHVRKSKYGKDHTYKRTSTIVHFRCDCCNNEFTRPKGKIDPKRLSNNYFHVCGNCNSKQFAQMKKIEKRKIWKMTASSNLPIGKL